MAKQRSKKQKTKTRSRTKKTSQTSEQLTSLVLTLLNANVTKAFTPRQMLRQFSLSDRASKAALPEVLQALESGGKIRELQHGKYQSTKKPEYILGQVDYVNPRFAFIISDELEEDIKVDSDSLMNAWDGDTVKVLSYGPGYSSEHGADRRPEGEVVEVVKRGRDEFVGRVEMSARYGFVIPDYRKLHEDIYVRLDDLNGASHGDKVIVKVTEWPKDDRNAVGKIINVLGKAGEHQAEMHSIMAEFGLPFDFPDHVEQEAEKMKAGITKKEIAKRRDFRNITTFTIDPEDAKDFDDALSIQKLDNGLWEIGVHIADVTHYLQLNTALEEEAERRATSVYLVDRVIPMLPEKLSNELCSLRPEEEKLTFSAVFEMDDEGQVKKEWFGRTVIYSDRRFTYEEAQERLETQKGDFAEEVIQLNTLAKKIRDERFAKGAINFETTEVRFKLDEKGRPIEVVPKVRKDAHKLIEEFMLLANKKVAEFAFNYKGRKEKNTFVYRVHDYPDAEKVRDFAEFAQRFGYKIQTSDKDIPFSMNKLMAAVEGKPEQDILQSIAIRTMAKAKYTTEASGHFGLAFKHYSHFTSPIRRYPDVMTHRLLAHYLNGGNSPEAESYEKLCEHSSEMEKRAADAERASVKYKQVEYMAQREQHTFAGIVSGVTEWGVYVEMVDSKCEGMVRMADMKDDYYEFDAKNFRIIGKRRKRIIALGDKVNVKVTNTDLDRRTIDLEFVR
uniref:Ribonuclease R n=1 Tax=Roseihalotalea indica TaxID=2867963 RepID=A0AA49GKZ6_9BACT|nr:ribonuclease R [Tunicatimonas sp. TK19036]